MPDGGSSTSPQYLALVQLTLRLREFVADELPALATDLFWNIFLPLAVTVALSGATLKIGLVLYSYIYPPSASELHKEALKILENTSKRPDITRTNSNTTTASSSRKTTATMRAIQQNEQQAEALLKRAIHRDDPIRCYEPAVLSLAALYVYRQHKPQEALRVLEPFVQDNSTKSDDNNKRKSKNGNKKTTTTATTLRHLAEFDAVRQDALAMMQGHGNMVQTELAEAEYLTILAAVAR
jgi:hypothetical protein